MYIQKDVCVPKMSLIERCLCAKGLKKMETTCKHRFMCAVHVHLPLEGRKCFASFNSWMQSIFYLACRLSCSPS